MPDDTVRFTIQPWETFLQYEEDDAELGNKVMLTMAVAMLQQVTGMEPEEVWVQLVQLAQVTADHAE